MAVDKEKKKQALLDEIKLREEALAAMKRVNGFIMKMKESQSNPFFQGLIKVIWVQMAMQDVAITIRKHRLEASHEATNR